MRFARSAFGSALLLLGFGGAAISLRVDNAGELAADRAVPDTSAAPRSLRQAPPPQQIANGDWADRLRSDDFWQQMRSPQSRPEAGSGRARGSARSETPRRAWGFRNEEGRSRAFSSRDGGSYRTVCVRLCDGYFWPVSFATARASLAQDRRKCEQSCESPARLYVSKDTEGPLEDMRDENGRFYRDLKTAFVYRTSYLESCKCRAHPWEAEAQARHAGYAQDAKSGPRQR
jgi:Protein of unknown function (DUF2865)